MHSQATELLKTRRARLTRARKAIVDIFLSGSSPIGAKAILTELEKRDIKVNKTTVYRELSFLTANNILREIFIKPNMVQYESALLPHHHHLVCNSCGKVSEVDCVIDEQKMLSAIKTKGFSVKTHKLELYGICVNCG